MSNFDIIIDRIALIIIIVFTPLICFFVTKKGQRLDVN